MKYFKLCMKDLQPYKAHHDPASIDFIAIGGKFKSFCLLLQQIRDKIFSSSEQNTILFKHFYHFY